MIHDRLPVRVEKGEKYTVRKADRKTGKPIEIEYEITDIRENQTTDGSPGAVIIVARGKRRGEGETIR